MTKPIRSLRAFGENPLSCAGILLTALGLFSIWLGIWNLYEQNRFNYDGIQTQGIINRHTSSSGRTHRYTLKFSYTDSQNITHLGSASVTKSFWGSTPDNTEVSILYLKDSTGASILLGSNIYKNGAVTAFITAIMSLGLGGWILSVIFREYLKRANVLRNGSEIDATVQRLQFMTRETRLIYEYTADGQLIAGMLSLPHRNKAEWQARMAQGDVILPIAFNPNESF